MKNKTIWIIVAVILVIVIIGCMTNWFGMKKPAVTTTSPASRIYNSSLSTASGIYYGKEKPTSNHLGLQWCCAERDTYGGCKFWEERSTTRPCDIVNA